MLKKSLLAIILVTLVGIAGIFIMKKSPTQDSTEQNGGDTELQAWQEDLLKDAFEPVDCPDIDRVLDEAHYQGPLIDTHIHIAPLPDNPSMTDFENEMQPLMGGNVTLTDYLCMMDIEGTSKVFGFFAVWDPILPAIELVQRTLDEYPDRFVPFIMPPDHDDSPTGYPTVDATTLEEMLNVSPGLFKGYGEIGLYARKGGAPELPPDSERLLAIYPVVRENNLLVYVHLGEGQQASFERALDANPDINFIWHGDQLIPYGNDGTQDLSAVEEILNNHPNAYYGVDELYGDVWLIRPEVSKEEFLAHFKNPEPLLEKDVATWKGFIERHPDQVLWGTDRGGSSPWSLDPEVALTLNTYSRAFIGLLDPSVQEKFAHQNAKKLIGE